VWVFLVWSLWKDAKKIKFITTDGHIIIKIGKYYYDSNYPSGSPDKKEVLNYYGHRKNIKSISLQQMIWFWSQVGRRKDEFKYLLEKIVPQVYTTVKEKFISRDFYIGLCDIPTL
jgi:hypothetical protein